MRLATALATALWLAPGVAQASALEDFRKARDAFDDARYGDAASLFEALVGGDEPAIDDPILIQESRKYLGVTYLYLGRLIDADLQFQRVLADDPDYPPLDPQTWQPAVIAAFEDSRTRLRAETEAREAAAAAAASRRQEELEQRTNAYIEALEEQAATEKRLVRNSRWLALVPFGVGQFQNGHDGLGWALLVSQTALTATAVTFGILHDGLDPVAEQAAATTPGSFERVERSYRLTNQVAFATLGILVVVGIVDAQLRFVPERVELEERPLPPDPRDPAGGADGADPDAEVTAILERLWRDRADGPRLELGRAGFGLRF